MKNNRQSFDKLTEAKQLLESGFVVPERVGFEHGGQWIQNPFYDETLRFKIPDPCEYYGAENVDLLVRRILAEASKQKDTVRSDVVWFRLSEDFCVSVWYVPDDSLGAQFQMKLELVGEDGRMGPACELVHDESYGTADLSCKAICETLNEVVEDAVYACEGNSLEGVCMDGLVDVLRLAQEIRHAFGLNEEKESKEMSSIKEVLEDAKARSKIVCSGGSVRTEREKI